MNKILVAYGLLASLGDLLELFGIIVQKVLRKTITFSLPCRRHIDEIPVGIIVGSGFESERNFSLTVSKEEFPCLDLTKIRRLYCAELRKLPVFIYVIK